MVKNTKRDVELLNKMYSYQGKITECLVDFNCMSQGVYALWRNKYALGYCTLLLLMFYKAYMNLTNSSAMVINRFMPMLDMRDFINSIEQATDTVDEHLLQEYILRIVEDVAVEVVRERCNYCLDKIKY